MQQDGKSSFLNLALSIALAVIALIGIIIGLWMTHGSQAASDQSATGSNGLLVGGGLTLGLILLIISIVAFIFFVILTIVILLKDGKEVVEAIKPSKSDDQAKHSDNPKTDDDYKAPF